MTRRLQSILVLMVMALFGGAAFAQSAMTFYDTDGWARESWRLQDVGKVTFDGGNIVVTHALGTYSVGINEVLSIKFTDYVEPDPTSIEKINTDAAQLRIATDDSAIRILGARDGSVAIWTVTGQQVYDNRGWQGEEINISHLDRGIYIITINNNTFKFKK